MALDPRAKLYLLLLSNLLLFFHVGTIAEAIIAAVLLIALFVAGRHVAGARMAVIYVLLLAGTWLSLAASNMWLHMLGLLSVGLRMIMPCLIAGVYAFTTTTASEFVCVMRRMRVPETLVIPCVVCIRFFPTIRLHYRRIRRAMALRGIAREPLALVCHPARTLEYILMPLLMNAASVAQDLSVAALTKGLGLNNAHTCMTQIRMRLIDWLTMLVCTVPLVLDIGGVL